MRGRNTFGGNYMVIKDLCDRLGTKGAQNHTLSRRNPRTVRGRAGQRDARIRAPVRSALPRRARACRSGPRPGDTAGRPGHSRPVLTSRAPVSEAAYPRPYATLAKREASPLQSSGPSACNGKKDEPAGMVLSLECSRMAPAVHHFMGSFPVQAP